jgi:hypothetical protein
MKLEKILVFRIIIKIIYIKNFLQFRQVFFDHCFKHILWNIWLHYNFFIFFILLILHKQIVHITYYDLIRSFTLNNIYFKINISLFYCPFFCSFYKLLFVLLIYLIYRSWHTFAFNFLYIQEILILL